MEGRGRSFRNIIANGLILISIGACSPVGERYYIWKAKYYDNRKNIVYLTGTSATIEDACPDISEGLNRVPDLSLNIGYSRINLIKNCSLVELRMPGNDSVDDVNQFNFED